MFDAIVTTLSQQWGLGGKARSFLQMLLVRMSDSRDGGFAGFVQMLRGEGIGNAVDAWMGAPQTNSPIRPAEVERALGDQTLVSDMVTRLGLERSKVLAALGFAIPAIVSLLHIGGVMPTGLPSAAEAFIGDRSAWAASTTSAPAAVLAVRQPATNWLPWVILGIVALLTLGYCTMQKRAEPLTSKPDQAAVTPASPTAAAPAGPPANTPDATLDVPKGAAVIATTVAGSPYLKVYFDSAKSVVSNEFGEKAAALVEHMKANPTETAVISGFNDPTGDPVANAKLAKARAEAVQQKLAEAGIGKQRTVLEKPAETTGTAATNAGSRRVDIILRQ